MNHKGKDSFYDAEENQGIPRGGTRRGKETSLMPRPRGKLTRGKTGGENST